MKKFKFLKEASPQQLGIFVLAPVFIFINALDYFKSREREDILSGRQERFTESVDAATGQVSSTKTKYENPHLTWYERLLCRGYQRSSSCSLKLRHPKTEEAEDLGIAIPEGAPAENHVVYFRGALNKNTAFSRNIEAPEAISPPAQIFDTPDQGK